jgi:hypothetical protein
MEYNDITNSKEGKTVRSLSGKYVQLLRSRYCDDLSVSKNNSQIVAKLYSYLTSVIGVACCVVSVDISILFRRLGAGFPRGSIPGKFIQSI